MISYLTDSVKMPTFSKRKVSAWIKQVTALQGCSVGDVNYIFCSDEKILEVNQKYLRHDYYTDIITFDYTEGKKIGGDIFISIDTVRFNAIKYAQSVEQELIRVMIHGILHLCGQNDKTNEHKTEMTEKENIALSIFNELNKIGDKTF